MWEQLKGIALRSDNMGTVPFTEFQKQLVYNQQGQIVLNKKGEPVKRLMPVKQKVNGKYLVEYICNILPKIIHHRNMLKLNRSSIISLFISFFLVPAFTSISQNCQRWYTFQIVIKNHLL